MAGFMEVKGSQGPSVSMPMRGSVGWTLSQGLIPREALLGGWTDRQTALTKGHASQEATVSHLMSPTPVSACWLSTPTDPC